MPNAQPITVSAPGQSSYLDPTETPQPCPLPTFPDDAPRGALSSDIAWRHSGWWQTRQRIIDSLERCRVSPTRLHNYRVCGSGAWLARDPDDHEHLTVTASHCHDRLCLPCQLSRSATILANLLPHVKDREVRFLTLTLKHSETPLTDQLDRLIDCFRNLRRTTLWNDRVDGGVYFVEVHRSADGTAWHPHLHVIIEGQYIAHSDLMHSWLTITGDSHIVHIRAIQDDAKIIRYVTRYVSKPLAHDLTHDPDHLDEAVQALASRRLCQCFGTWHRLKLLAKSEPIDWHPIEPLFATRARARKGDLDAIALLAKLKRYNPCSPTKHAKNSHPPPPIP